MHRLIKLFLFISFTFLTTCTITEETYLKNDYLGTYTLKVAFTNTKKEYSYIRAIRV